MEFFELLTLLVAESAEPMEEIGVLDKIGNAIGDFFKGIWNWCVDVCKGIGDWFKNLGAKIWEMFLGLGKGVVWLCVIVLIVAGFAGTIIPFMPGTTLILAGCCLHFFAMGLNESGLSWVSLVVITVLYVASVIVDNFSGAIGAKWFGSSKWGIVGAILGGIVGMFVGNLLGIIIGPIVGVFIFELIFGKKKVKEAGSSTVGTVVGSGAGIIAGVAIGVLMIACYLLDIFVWKG